MRPDTTEKVPIILVISIYFGPLTSDNFDGWDLGGTSLPWVIENFLPHGYAIAALSMRGTGFTGGCWGVAPQEMADFSQVISFLAEQPWSNGNVGLYGLSAAGISQWMAAATGNPHLKTIVPIHSAADAYSFTYRNGTLSPTGNGGVLVGGAAFGGAYRVAAGPPVTGMQQATSLEGCADLYTQQAESWAMLAVDPSRGVSVVGHD